MAPRECFRNIHENLGIVEKDPCLSEKEDEKSWEEAKSPKLTEVSDTHPALATPQDLWAGPFAAHTSPG